jgi:hypothetical protein
VFAAWADPAAKARWFASVSLVTVELAPDGDGTRLTFTEDGAFFDGLEDPAVRRDGTGSLLDALAPSWSAIPQSGCSTVLARSPNSRSHDYPVWSV